MEWAEHVIGGLDQRDASRADGQRREVAGENVAIQLGQAAGQLHTGRTAATDDDIEVAGSDTIGRRGLEPADQVRPESHCVSGGLQREGVIGHAGYPEVLGDRSGRDDQRVVGQRFATIDHDPTSDQIETGDRGHTHGHIGLATNDPPHRVGDVVGMEARRRHLVQERLERVVVAGIDEGDGDPAIGQTSGHPQPAEPGADHHDPVRGLTTARATGVLERVRSGGPVVRFHDTAMMP